MLLLSRLFHAIVFYQWHDYGVTECKWYLKHIISRHSSHMCSLCFPKHSCSQGFFWPLNHLYQRKVVAGKTAHSSLNPFLIRHLIFFLHDSYKVFFPLWISDSFAWFLSFPRETTDFALQFSKEQCKNDLAQFILKSISNLNSSRIFFFSIFVKHWKLLQ